MEYSFFSVFFLINFSISIKYLLICLPFSLFSTIAISFAVSNVNI